MTFEFRCSETGKYKGLFWNIDVDTRQTVLQLRKQITTMIKQVTDLNMMQISSSFQKFKTVGLHGSSVTDLTYDDICLMSHVVQEHNPQVTSYTSMEDENTLNYYKLTTDKISIVV